MSIENPEQKIPTVSGVYQIRCKSNGKIYIGSAVNLRQRWDGHRRALRKQRHHNVHLQAAWNRYAEASFEFTILEQVDVGNLLETEQSWMDRTQCTDPRVGFNLSPRAGSPGDALAETWEGFYDTYGRCGEWAYRQSSGLDPREWPTKAVANNAHWFHSAGRSTSEHHEPESLLSGMWFWRCSHVRIEERETPELQRLDLERRT